jgi:hypothetical protein
MKKLLLSLVLILPILVNTINAQVSWTFTPGAAPSTNTSTNLTVSSISQGNNNGTTILITTTSPSGVYAGASAAENAGAAARIGALNTAASGSAYFEFTLTPSAGYTVTLTAIQFGSRSTSTGPAAYTLRSSADGYAADIVAGTLPITSPAAWALQTPATFVSTSPIGTAVTYRIYGYNGAGSPAINTANWRIDDLSLSLSTALPVTLISFKATLNERQQATLKWATASEFNNDFFEIERSKNATDFESLGKIVGRGTVQGQNDYTFTDEVPLKGINYYRLKQVDYDGQFSYSRLSSVIKDGDGTISLFPNPTANVLKINFEDADQIENVTFYNAFGRVVKTVSGKQDKYEVADLPTGKYILQIRLADGREVRNVFLKN